MAYLKDFRDRIANKNYPSFLQLWEEYCYSDEPEGIELKQVLEEIKNSSLKEPFGKHVERALPLWRQIQDPKVAHEVLRLILDIQTTNSAILAELAYNFLKEKYENTPFFNEKIRLVGLRSKENFQSSIRNFELLTHMKKGNFVFHTTGWGTGEIFDVSLLREELSLEFDLVVGLKTLSFDNAFKTLIPLENDHFLAQRFGNPDGLEKRAKEQPLEVIHSLLRDLGPKTAAEIKEEICDLVIPSKEWNRWWQSTRAKIKKDTKISVPKSLNEPFMLREKELSHEMSLHKALEDKPSIEQTIQMIYSFMRDFSETLKNQEFKDSLNQRLKEALKASDIEDHHILQIHFFLEDLSNIEEPSDIAEKIIKNAPSVAELLKKIQILTFKKRILQIVKKTRADWEKNFLDLLFTVDTNLLRDFILQVLKKESSYDLLKSKLHDLILEPLNYPEVFVWYFQKIIHHGDHELPFSDPEGQNRFFENLLILLDNIEQKVEYRDLCKKIIYLLTSNRFELVRKIMQQATLEDVKEYLLLATKCESLSDHDIKIVHSLAQVIFPSLKAFQKDQLIPEEENVLWTTEKGYHHLQNRIKQIATIETVQNAKEIEAARELGDLRENAEFKAALEKRDRLQSELKLLSDQLNRARIITPADVSLDQVGPGNVVKCSDSKQKTLEFTLLGPFDANPEENILSLQSKFAQSMLGKKIGQKFTFQNEDYTITEIGTFFSDLKS